VPQEVIINALTPYSFPEPWDPPDTPYKAEREYFGYQPAFIPNPVTFDATNRPFILTFDGCLQILNLNNDGKWGVVDLVRTAELQWLANCLAGKYDIGKDYSGFYCIGPAKVECSTPPKCEIIPGNILLSGEANDNRVVFDANGDAYTILRTSRAVTFDKHLLLHASYPDYTTWTPYAIPGTEDGVDAKLEHADGHNLFANPPNLILGTPATPPSILVYISQRVPDDYNKAGVVNGSLRGRLEYVKVTKDKSGLHFAPYSVLEEALPNVVLDSEGFISGPYVDQNHPKWSPIVWDGNPIVPGLAAGASTQPNYMVTHGDKTYIVFIGVTNYDAMTAGSPTYVVTVDNSTDPPKFHPPQFLGASIRWLGKDPQTSHCCDHGTWSLVGQEWCCAYEGACIVGEYRIGSAQYPEDVIPDVHDFPAICVDSLGRLHVIIGAHNRQFQYVMGTPGAEMVVWGPLSLVGEPDCSGQYSYPALACDADDNLHLVARDGNGALVYLRKPANGSWDTTRKVLVEATWHTGYYTDWYHNLTIDQKGRLFVSYIFYANQLKKKETQAYEQKWPSEVLQADLADQTTPCWATMPADPTQPCWMTGVKVHDPVVLISTDGGDSFRLATTEDFLIGADLCPDRIVPVPAQGPHYVPPWEPVESYPTFPNQLPETGTPPTGWFQGGQ
jgi:hypothetical protein